MSMRLFSALLSAVLIASPCWAQKKGSVPKAQGSYAATDKYVDEYSKAMKSANAEIDAIRAAIQAIQIPAMSKMGSLAAAAAIAAEYGGVGAIMLKAEAAHMKMLKHLMNSEGSTDQEFDVQLGLPSFEGNKNDAPLKPKYDPTFNTQRPTQAVASKPETLTASAPPSRPAGPSAPETVGQKPSLNPISSKYGYGTPGKDVGVGFQEPLAPSQHQTTSGQTTAAPIRQDNSAATTSGAGASGSGMDSALGPSSGSGGAGGKSDEKPSENPDKTQLTQNSSDVAAKAYERMKQRQAEAERKAEEKRQKAEQERKEKQQKQMMMAQMAAQFASQALQSAGKMMEQTGKNGTGAQGEGQKKEGQANQSAASAPPGT